MKFMMFVALAALAFRTNPDEIIQRSLKSNEANWTEALNYSYIELDVARQGEAAEAAKTYEVLTIEGSPYNKLIALNDQPLSSQQKAEEVRKLQQETDSRRHES